MALIEPIREDIQHPQQLKRYSSRLRFWHWANLIIITGSLLTVLINSTITDQRGVQTLVKSELQKAGATVTDKQASSVAHTLSDNVWAVHTYFGYALAALLVFRLALEALQLADQKFIRKLKTAYQQFNTIKVNRQMAKHELTVKVIYGIFYIILIVIALTGLTLAFESSLPFPRQIIGIFKEIHGFCMYLVLAFIAVHLAGVFLAERKDQKGITSDMINGGDSQQKSPTMPGSI
jgi:Ni/Fe-hydrogenase 1 B-type cytochrome subunit